MGKRHILIDTRNVISADPTIAQRWWPAVKHGEPVVCGDKPWERHVLRHGSVHFDQGRFKIWYNCEAACPPPGNTFWVGYAESNDGIHWEKPELDVQPWGEHRHTNLVNLVRGSPSIIADQSDPDPAQRFKACGFIDVEQVEPERGRSYPGNGFYLAHSADGIDWTEYPTEQPVGTTHDVGTFVPDRSRGRYLGTAKQMVRYNLVDRRSIAITESQDFRIWSSPITVLVTDSLDDRLALERGAHHAEFYGMSLMPYEDLYVGFPWVFYGSWPLMPDPRRRTGWWGEIEPQLAFSYDGYYWSRTPNRQPFIPLGLPGEFDSGLIQLIGRPVEVGDEVWIYYSGASRDHAYFVSPLIAHTAFEYRTDMEWEKVGNVSVISLAKIKQDRYASLSTGTQGSFTVAHGRLDGRRLLVNARARLGSVKVQILDADGSPISGFTVEDCKPFTGDSVRGEVEWQAKSLADLPPDCEVQFRFVLDYADVFAYQMAD